MEGTKMCVCVCVWLCQECLTAIANNKNVHAQYLVNNSNLGFSYVMAMNEWATALPHSFLQGFKLKESFPNSAYDFQCPLGHQ